MYNYIINYNQTIVKLTETSYDNMCKYIYNILKSIIINTTSEMAIQLQQQRERQQKMYTPNIHDIILLFAYN